MDAWERRVGLSDAVVAVREWMDDTDWSVTFQEFLEDFFGEERTIADMPLDDALEILSEEAEVEVEMTCFEDFLTVVYEGESENTIVDAFLSQQGDRLEDEQREYLRALRDSRMGLYEVVEAVPESHLVVRDLLANSEPFRVDEVLGSRFLRSGTTLAARVVRLNEEPGFTGVLLELSRDAREGILEAFEETVKEIVKESPKALRKEPYVIRGARRQAQMALPPIVLDFWVAEQLIRESGPLMLDQDGESLLFITLAYPIVGGVDDVAKRLEEAGDFRSVGADVWLRLAADGETILAAIRLSENVLYAETNSSPRADAIHERLRTLVGPQLGEPSRSEQTPEERYPDLEDDLPPETDEEVREVVTRYLDNHYRKTLNEPVPALGGRTPTEMVETPEGRLKVAEWLRYMEKSSADLQPELRDYDLTWIWEELGLTDLRRTGD